MIRYRITCKHFLLGASCSAYDYEVARGDNGLIVELASSAKFLGMILKEHRERAGFSLRQLAKVSGVTNSEISKIESGNQSCRLDSLLRICAALGVSVGAVADSILTVQSFFYQDEIEKHPEFCAVVKKRQMAHQQAFFLACSLAGFAAQLVVSSKPTVVAGQIDYPTTELRAAFLRFAARAESKMNPAARRLFLYELKRQPMEVLKREDLFSEPSFIDYYNHSEREIFNPSTQRRFQLSDTTWAAILSHGESKADSALDSVTASGKTSDVKLTMATLLQRLNKATAAHGAKSKLAKYMGVPLPNVSQWLSGEREPSGETTLRLLHWVEQQERKT